jgi:hypothetical protein
MVARRDLDLSSTLAGSKGSTTPLPQLGFTSDLVPTRNESGQENVEGRCSTYEHHAAVHYSLVGSSPFWGRAEGSCV